MLHDGRERAALVDSRQRLLHQREVLADPVRAPAVQEPAVGTLGVLGVLASVVLVAIRAVAEDGAVLHDDVEEVHPVQIGESLEVLVRVAVVEVGDGVGDVALSTSQERAPESHLVERAHPPEVAHDAEALWELDGAPEPGEELPEHHPRRSLGPLRELGDDGNVGRVQRR